jgi:hypothetical protein
MPSIWLPPTLYSVLVRRGMVENTSLRRLLLPFLANFQLMGVKGYASEQEKIGLCKET